MFAFICCTPSADLTWFQRSGGIRAMLRRLVPPLSLEYLRYKDKEQWDENEVNEGGRKHPADNRRPNGVLGSRSGAGGYGEWQDTEEECQ